MLKVKFYDTVDNEIVDNNLVDDNIIKFAVIIAKYHGKWVFCKHRERSTYEVPGGHREIGENILDTAKRELNEETCASEFDISPVCVYSVLDTEKNEESFGMLYFADIKTFEGELHSEIEKTIITENLPTEWTYPLIQPKLMKHAAELGFVTV